MPGNSLRTNTDGWAEEGELRGCSPTKSILKRKTDFVDTMMISNVLHDLPLGRNQPLKLVDE